MPLINENVSYIMKKNILIIFVQVPWDGKRGKGKMKIVYKTMGRLKILKMHFSLNLMRAEGKNSCAPWRMNLRWY